MARGDTSVTTDHDAIRRWVDRRGGLPATVKATSGAHGPGVLRIAFPGTAEDAALRTIAWEDFFAKFDKDNLAFVCQDETADGGPGRAYKIVTRQAALTETQA